MKENFHQKHKPKTARHKTQIKTNKSAGMLIAIVHHIPQTIFGHKFNKPYVEQRCLKRQQNSTKQKRDRKPKWEHISRNTKVIIYISFARGWERVERREDLTVSSKHYSNSLHQLFKINCVEMSLLFFNESPLRPKWQPNNFIFFAFELFFSKKNKNGKWRRRKCNFHAKCFGLYCSLESIHKSSNRSASII